MFCPNCCKDCGDAKFCSECGAKLTAPEVASATEKKTPKSIYQANVNGYEINLLNVVLKYGANTLRAYSHLKREYGISKEQARELFKPFEAQKKLNTPKKSIKDVFSEASNEIAEKKRAEEELKSELDRSRQVYCPKCFSTSISANQKGFGFIRGALGANIALDVGLIAGGIGSKKIICTCLKCGHQWKPGKK